MPSQNLDPPWIKLQKHKSDKRNTYFARLHHLASFLFLANPLFLRAGDLDFSSVEIEED